jgi:hypothetical protein
LKPHQGVEVVKDKEEDWGKVMSWCSSCQAQTNADNVTPLNVYKGASHPPLLFSLLFIFFLPFFLLTKSHP